MKILEIEKASKPLADYASDLGSDSLVITSNNKPVATLVSIKDTDRESLALGLSPEFGKIHSTCSSGGEEREGVLP